MSDLTVSPASRRDLAVPPDATNDRPTDTSRLANSTSPVLSDTLSKAEREGHLVKSIRQTIINSTVHAVENTQLCTKSDFSIKQNKDGILWQ